MIVFRDLYESLKDTEEAFERMDVDIDNAMCGNPKCILTDAQEKLLDSYMELANVDVDFCELDFTTALKKLSWCFDCVGDEFKDLLPLDPPEPDDSVDNCPSDGIVIQRDEIKRFRIYERTYTHESIPSPVQVYMVNSLPYEFVPSVPPAYSSHEKYYVSWDRDYEGLRIRLDHDLYPEGMGAPRGSYNVTLVVAELTDEARVNYGVDEVKACRAYLITPGVKWKSSNPFEYTVDGNYQTYPSYENEPPEVVVIYQFVV